jgi:hypothetical protein
MAVEIETALKSVPLEPECQPLSAGPLPEEVEAALGSGVRGVHRAFRKHQPITGAQRVAVAADTERDLALDYPEALVVVVGVRLVVGARVVAPTEDLEALGLKPFAQRSLARLRER